MKWHLILVGVYYQLTVERKYYSNNPTIDFTLVTCASGRNSDLSFGGAYCLCTHVEGVKDVTVNGECCGYRGVGR